MKNKRGVEWEIGNILIAIIILAVLSFAVIFLLKIKGGQSLDIIKNFFRFGR